MIRSIALVLVFSLVFVMNPGIYAQTTNYKENGEVFVLIGDGSQRGVYTLNNTTPGGQTQMLYTPQMFASNLKANATGDLYTFTTDKDAGFTTLAGPVRMRLRWEGGQSHSWDQFYGYHAYTHAWHGGFATSIGDHYGHGDPSTITTITAATASSKPSGYIPFGWDTNNDGIPDAGAPACTTSWYLVPNPSVYHSFIRARNQYSLWPQTDIEADNGQTGQKPYYVVKETQQGKKTKWTLWKWTDPSTGGSGNQSQGVQAESDEIKISRDYKNGCHDGCTGGAAGASIPAIEYDTHVAVNVYGTSYFYRSAKTSASYEIKKGATVYNGTATNPTISGSPVIGNATDCQFFAVSTKGNNVDWVYCLNKTIIRNWMVAEGFPGGATANVDEVVVSDQWWLDGGIVFSLDKAAGVVNMFERNENAPNGYSKITYSSQIPVGQGVDSLGSDGYGNLYFCKTTYSPSDATGLVIDNPPVGHIDPNYAINWVPEPIAGQSDEWQADIQLLQEVRKEVFRYGYFSKTNRSEGTVILGYNTYHVRVSAGQNSTPNVVPSSWTAVSPVTQTGNIANVAPMEITAINYATPPDVNGFTHARLDIDGPYVIDFTNPSQPVVDKVNAYYVDPNNPNVYGLREKQLYLFMLENYPVPSIKDYKTNPIGDRAVNIRSGEDRDIGTGLTDVSANSIADRAWYNAPIQGTTLEMEVNVKWSNQTNKNAARDYIGGFVSSLCYSYFDNLTTSPLNEGDRDADARTDSPKYKWYLYQKVDKYGNIYDVNGRGREICKMESDNAMFGVLLEGGIYDLFVASDYSWFDYDNLTGQSSVADRWGTNVMRRHSLARNKREITGTGEYIPDDPWNSTTTFGSYTGTLINNGKGNWAHYRFHVVSVPPAPPTGVIVAKAPLSAWTNTSDYSMYYMNEDSVQVWEIQDITADNKITKMRAASPPDPGITHSQLEWLLPYQLKINLSLEKTGGVGLVTYSSGKSYNALGALSDECFSLKTGQNDPSTPEDESTLFSVPSEPGTYRMDMTATRMYHYYARISTTIHDDVLDEDITLVQEFEFPNYFECTGSTQVMVRDIDSGDGQDTVLYKTECFDSDYGTATGTAFDVSSPEYFLTSGDPVAWHVLGSDFLDPANGIDTVKPSTIVNSQVYNPKVIKYYFVDDNPFGNEDPTNYNSPSNSNGYLNKGNSGASPDIRNPSFIGYWNDDYLFANRHEQNYYARMTYEVFLPGLTPDMLSSAKYSDLKDFVGNLQATQQLNSLLDLSFQKYTELSGGSGIAPTATRECVFLEKHFNTSNVMVYHLPKNDARYPNMENDYFAGSTVNSPEITITPNDIHSSVTPDKSKSYFSVTFNMKNLLNKLDFSYEASANLADWVDTAPNVNRPHQPLSMKFFVSDNSGNRKEYPLGTMRIRDNDSPNIFGTVEIPVASSTGLTGITTVYLPSNIQTVSYRQGYQLLPGADPVYYNVFTKYNRGPWIYSNEASALVVLANLSDSPYMSPANYFPLEDKNRSVTLKSDIPIREDTRVKVALAGKDNARDINDLKYVAKLNIGAVAYEWKDTDTKNYQYVIFSEPGTAYKLGGWCADTAYSWDGPPNYAPNYRYFSFEIGPVYETKIKVHTIQNAVR